MSTLNDQQITALNTFIKSIQPLNEQQIGSTQVQQTQNVASTHDVIPTVLTTMCIFGYTIEKKYVYIACAIVIMIIGYLLIRWFKNKKKVNIKDETIDGLNEEFVEDVESNKQDQKQQTCGKPEEKKNSGEKNDQVITELPN